MQLHWCRSMLVKLSYKYRSDPFNKGNLLTNDTSTAQGYMNYNANFRDNTRSTNIHRQRTSLTAGFTKELNVSHSSQFNPIHSLAHSKLQQFKMFSRLHPNYTFKLHYPRFGRINETKRQAIIKMYQYKTQVWITRGYIFFEIAETCKRKITKGGSSLFCTVTSKDIVSLCTYTDHVNGSYVVQCPAYAKHVHIKINVLDVNYHQFQDVMQELDIVVVNRKIFSSIILKKPGAYWSTRMHHGWTLHGLIQSSDAARTSANMCKSVRKMDKFYMVGSSHMRYYYHYLLAECRLFDKKFWRQIVFVQVKVGSDLELFIHDFADESLSINCNNNTKFHSTVDRKFFREFGKEQETEDMHFQTFVYKTNTTDKTDDDRHMIICEGGPNMKIGLMIQTGSHDLSRNPLRRNLAYVLPSLKQTFEQLHAAKFVKILVTGPPPFNSVQENIISGRSNDEIAIYDSSLMKIAKENNLPYFSMFEVIYLRYRDGIKHNSHYVACKPKRYRCEGNLGKLAFQEAVRTLTNQFS